MARQARHDLGQSRLCKLALSIHGSGRKTALFFVPVRISGSVRI